MEVNLFAVRSGFFCAPLLAIHSSLLIGSSTNGRTSIFRSTNQGVTWSKVNGGNDLTGSLFEQGGAVLALVKRGMEDDFVKSIGERVSHVWGRVPQTLITGAGGA
jgi:hypothetical protein